jgi:hypothetical protein
MSTDSGVSVRTQPVGTVGGVRYRDDGPRDRVRAEELEPGRTLGDRQLRRLEVTARGFRRLLERDSLVLAEFEQFHKQEQLRARLADGGPGLAELVELHENGAAA